MDIFFKIVLLIFFISCSTVQNKKAIGSSIDVGDGLVLNNSNEEGIAELIIPEVEEYSKVKKDVEMKAKLEKLELGSEDIIKDASEEAVESPLSLILEEELKPEIDLKRKDIPGKVKVSIKETKEAKAGPVTAEKFEIYIVQRKDSLLKISYKLFRDGKRWKDIVSWNKQSFIKRKRIYVGQKLKFVIKDTYGRVWHPQGQPYFVRKGENLGEISKKVYNSASYWKEIWQNNSILLRSPDRVYSGLTIYIPEYQKVLAKKFKYSKGRLPANSRGNNR